jgi:hypothetical protein
MFRVPSFCQEWRTGRPPRLRIPAARTQTPYCKQKVAAILSVKITIFQAKDTSYSTLQYITKTKYKLACTGVPNI